MQSTDREAEMRHQEKKKHKKVKVNNPEDLRHKKVIKIVEPAKPEKKHRDLSHRSLKERPTSKRSHHSTTSESHDDAASFDNSSPSPSQTQADQSSLAIERVK